MRSKTGSLIFNALCASLFLTGAADPCCRHKAAIPPPATIQNFYDALVAGMKAGGTTKSRFRKA